jgi:CubicO group peptidase (beta-lactamase class C family)
MRATVVCHHNMNVKRHGEGECGVQTRLAQTFAIVIGLQLCAAAVAMAQIGGAPPPPTPWPTKSRETSTAEEQGMDSGKLAAVVEAVGSRRLDSLMVIRHGKIVAEAYYAPYVAGVPHDLRSVTKSVIGTLTAIEVRDGLLDSVDHPIIDLFSDKKILNADTDERKKSITVQNLLDMASGIEWKEKAYTPDETVMKMYRESDRVEFVLNQPMATTPGSAFNYNSGNPYVLSALITRKTGQNAFEFAKQELFAPLGITSAWWGRPDAQGVTDGESGLFLTPQDMARIGYLYLHDGMWDGKQIIPASWVERARDGKIAAGIDFRYANLWWSLPEKGAFMALGRHSQMIIVLPKLDIVTVITGSLPDGEFYYPYRLIDDISAAVRSEHPLPNDSVAQSLLAAAIKMAASEKPSAEADNPEMAKTISGKIYQLKDNPLHVKTISLNFSGSVCRWTQATDIGKPDRSLALSEGQIGLDGISRSGPPGRFGPSTLSAAKGRWLNDHIFEIDRHVLGHGETESVELAFDRDLVTITYRNTDGVQGYAYGQAQ